MATNNVETLVKVYTEIDDEIKSLSKRLNALKSQKLTYSEQISDHISGSGKDYVKIGENTIKLLNSKKKVFNRKNLEESMKNNVKNEAIERVILDQSMEEREDIYLKRVKAKN
jgi:hypothetical protein